MNFWEKQILRASELADVTVGTNELLVFYTHLLRAQNQVYELLRTQQNWVPSGELQQDLAAFRSAFPRLLSAVEHNGPPPLVDDAQKLKTWDSKDLDEMFLAYWHTPSDTEFFAKAFLQPYGYFVIATGNRLVSQSTASSERRCPFCGGKPQLSFLQNKDVTAESGNRDLMCAKCVAVWPFRRAVCANCGEEHPSKLGYFQTTAIDYVRVEACDTCKYYLKGVDLTRLGNAQPLVDELAAAPLDLWATEHGYKKIELNLVGL